MHATHALSHWPLVGRYDEYAAALQVLTGNDSGTAFGVLLIGESGVGKSTLASRLEEAVAETAHVVTVTSPSRAQPVMLGALAPLLTDVGAHADASPISVFQAAATRLARDSGGRPVVLRVEDGHLLDGASAGVLRMLAMSRRARLLVTSRPNPAIPDDLLALWKDGWLRWIDVAPLDRAETTLLLREALGGVIGRDTDRRMWEASLGNPLYLRELVRSALSRDELLHNHGVWTWTGPVVPGRLIELVTAELRRRPDGEREVLEIVSLAESLPLPLLFELADTDTVDPLVEAGMLVVDNAAAPPTVTLSHPVYGEAIRSLVPPDGAGCCASAWSGTFPDRTTRRCRTCCGGCRGRWRRARCPSLSCWSRRPRWPTGCSRPPTGGGSPISRCWPIRTTSWWPARWPSGPAHTASSAPSTAPRPTSTSCTCCRTRC